MLRRRDIKKGISMKLFQVNYLESNDDVSYLTVGNDNDTEETIEKREMIGIVYIFLEQQKSKK